MEFELCRHDLWANGDLASEPVSDLVGPIHLENDSADDYNYQLGDDDDNGNASSVGIKEAVAI